MDTLSTKVTAPVANQPQDDRSRLVMTPTCQSHSRPSDLLMHRIAGSGLAHFLYRPQPQVVSPEDAC